VASPAAVPVLLAVTGAPYEDALVSALGRAPSGLAVVRRCVDLADLLAAAQAGTARAALVDGGLRRLDAAALSVLAQAGVVPVGLFPDGDDDAERRLRQLGVGSLASIPTGAVGSPAVLAAAVAAALARGSVSAETADPVIAERAPAERPPTSETGRADPGRLVAVWGPTGAPGRTTVAVALADELARLGESTLLADADTYGAAVAQVLGLLDEAPGLATACRAANAGTLDVPALARTARSVGPHLRVLTGLPRPDRWPELRPGALSTVWRLARRLVGWTVVDCGFGLEQDEELAYDTAAPRRNGSTVATLGEADVVVLVGSADPVGMQRLIRHLPAVRDLAPDADLRVLVNRVRPGVAGPDPWRELPAALQRYAGVAEAVLVPDDRVACDAALAAGRTLAEVAPGSPARAAVVALARQLAGRPPGEGRPRRRGARSPLGLRAAPGRQRAGR